MNRQGPIPPYNQPMPVDQAPSLFIEKVVSPTWKPLALWYRFTAPPEVPPNATLAQRELARRGRLSSTILLGMQIFLLASLPIAIFGKDHSLLWVLLPSLVISIVVLQINRLGKITLAGIILVGGFELGYIYGLLSTPGGLGVNDLPRFDLMVEPVLLAVSFLPPASVYLVALGNSVFIWADLTFMPHTAELGRLLAEATYTVIETPVALQIIVAFVVFLWVRSTNRAIERADRAEIVATLEHTLAEQKRQLEVGVQQILQTHIQVANGNFSARAPLTQDNMLWQIANSLNRLLARFQRLSVVEQELQETQVALQYTKSILQSSLSAKEYIEMQQRFEEQSYYPPTNRFSPSEYIPPREATKQPSQPLENETLRPFLDWKRRGYPDHS